jgi:hypothetical protein
MTYAFNCQWFFVLKRAIQQRPWIREPPHLSSLTRKRISGSFCCRLRVHEVK